MTLFIAWSSYHVYIVLQDKISLTVSSILFFLLFSSLIVYAFCWYTKKQSFFFLCNYTNFKRFLFDVETDNDNLWNSEEKLSVMFLFNNSFLCSMWHILKRNGLAMKDPEQSIEFPFLFIQQKIKQIICTIVNLNYLAINTFFAFLLLLLLFY